MQPELLLDEVQLAKRLGMSRKALSIRRWRGGGPPFVRLGRRVFYRPEDVQEWLASNRWISTAAQPTARADKEK